MQTLANGHIVPNPEIHKNPIPIRGGKHGHVLGTVRHGIYYRTLQTPKHRMHSECGWCVDTAIISKLDGMGAHGLVITDTHAKTVLSAHVADFFEHGWRVNYGYGAQTCLPCDYWHETPTAPTPKRNSNNTPPPENQTSIWDVLETDSTSTDDVTGVNTDRVAK